MYNYYYKAIQEYFFASSTPCNLMIDFANIPCRCSDILFFSSTVHQNNITTHWWLFFSIKTVLSLVIRLIKSYFVRLNIFTWKADENGFFPNFSCMFLNPNIFSNLNSNCSNFLYMRNLQEQVKKHSVTKIVLTFHYSNKLF